MKDNGVDRKAAEMLEAAALVIVTPGWHCKGSLARIGKGVGHETFTDDPAAQSFCAIGALRAAQYALKHLPAISERAEGALYKELDHRPITTWNDRPSTTSRDVAAKMWAAAQKLRGQNE